MMYNVQTWDEEHKCVRYHSVVDAIDYEDAADVVRGLYPDQRLLAVTKINAQGSYSFPQSPT